MYTIYLETYHSPNSREIDTTTSRVTPINHSRTTIVEFFAKDIEVVHSLIPETDRGEGKILIGIKGRFNGLAPVILRLKGEKEENKCTGLNHRANT